VLPGKIPLLQRYQILIKISVLPTADNGYIPRSDAVSEFCEGSHFIIVPVDVPVIIQDMIQPPLRDKANGASSGTLRRPVVFNSLITSRACIKGSVDLVDLNSKSRKKIVDIYQKYILLNIK